MRMNARATVIVGANFGDEGKGLATDYFCAMADGAPVAVRFSGGAQAGHTVVTPVGQRHVFHHFGAGTHAGAATFLSRFFVVNPLLWADEREALPDARVVVDPDAPVTTPYDMLINQELETWRGVARHGSCGLGINETLERDDRAIHRLRVRDLCDAASLSRRIDAIQVNHVLPRLDELRCEPSRWLLDMLASSELKSSFLSRAADFIAAVEIDDADFLRGFRSIVFEGSQGLGLDEQYGCFPHVTRGRTGAVRAVELANQAGVTDVEIVYVSRAYVTRHGAGPLPNEDPSLAYYDATNVVNAHQGHLRFAPLDVDCSVALVSRDVMASRAAAQSPLRLAAMVTCMDQVMERGRYRLHGTWHMDMEALPALLAGAWHCDTFYQSSGPTRHHVTTG